MSGRVGSPAVDAVRDFLARGPATTLEVIAATGYCRSTVEAALTVLRKQRARQVRNLRRAPRGAPGARQRVRRPSREWPALVSVPCDGPPVRIVPAAIAARTELELAWKAAA